MLLAILVHIHTSFHTWPREFNFRTPGLSLHNNVSQPPNNAFAYVFVATCGPGKLHISQVRSKMDHRVPGREPTRRGPHGIYIT